MGLLDKAKKKKEGAAPTETPSAKPVTVSSEEEFLKTCRGLTQDFKGLMLLSGEVEGERYSASLIIDSGDIIGSTFEFKGMIVYRDQSIEGIKTKLKGSKGILKIFEFGDEDMPKLMESNKTAFLADPVPLSSLGIKIKMLIDEWAESCEKEGGGKGIRPIRLPSVFKGQGQLNLIELARNAEQLKVPPPEPPQVPEEELELAPQREEQGGLPSLGGGDRKLDEMHRIREERQKKLEEKLAKGKKKDDATSASTSGGEKVLTTIDKLYSLVKKYKKLKIDDKLSHSLGVNRAQIEEWAVILEEHDLIELRYPAIGEPEILMKEDTE